MKLAPICIGLTFFLGCTTISLRTPFPQLTNLNGAYVVINYHGCGNCLTKILKATRDSKIKVIILSLTKAETKALQTFYVDRKNILVTDDYERQELQDDLVYYQFWNDIVVEKKDIKPEQVDDWIDSTL